MIKNKPVIIAGLAAGALLVGLVLGPLSGQFSSPGTADAQGTGKTKKVYLTADEVEVEIAPANALHPGGIRYNAMVWNGTIPGPVIAVDQGDTVEITVENRGSLIHSMDFHAGYGPTKALSGNIKAGEKKTWTFEAVNAGVFLYHCGADGLNGVWEHIANGMYGGIVVHPANEKPAKEFYMVFGEIYNNADQGLFVGANRTGSLDLAKFLAGNPDLVLTNGMAHKYVPSIGQQAKIELNPEAEVFKVKPGELTRWYIVNAGPNDYVAFHFIAGMIDVKDGSIKNRYGTQLLGDETWTIPPGSGTVIESVFPEEGVYVGVDHSMNDVLKGAAFAVLATNNATSSDHPEGTWVPPKGSEIAAGRPATAAGGMTNGTGSMSGEDEGEEEGDGEDGTLAPTTGSNQTSTSTSSSSNNSSDSNNNNSNSTIPTASTSQPRNSTSSTPPAATTPASGGISVSIVQNGANLGDQSYQPNPVQVSEGTTITWTNDDTAAHTVTSGNAATGTPDGNFDSGIMGPKRTFSFTFDEEGQYNYYCILHPAMVGTVVVTS